MRIYGLEFVFNENGIFAKPKENNNIMIPALTNDVSCQNCFEKYIELKNKIKNSSRYIEEYDNHVTKFSNLLLSILENGSFFYDTVENSIENCYWTEQGYIMYLECTDDTFSREDDDYCAFFVSSKDESKIKVLKNHEISGENGKRTKYLLVSVYTKLLFDIKIGCWSFSKKDSSEEISINPEVYGIYSNRIVNLDKNKFKNFIKNKTLIKA